jgi:hypothetical protein
MIECAKDSGHYRGSDAAINRTLTGTASASVKAANAKGRYAVARTQVSASLLLGRFIRIVFEN